MVKDSGYVFLSIANDSRYFLIRFSRLSDLWSLVQEQSLEDEGHSQLFLPERQLSHRANHGVEESNWNREQPLILSA